MTVSVVIRSKDEADRLRLVLASLAHQTVRPQVVVVDDGSSDHTPAVVAEAALSLDIVGLRNDTPNGRSAASNAGARAAGGDILLFLDGDTLAAPDFVARHADVHSEGGRRVVRGETWHLRCTRPFLDPETGSPQPSEAARVGRMPAAELARALVTRRQIAESFETIAARGQPGIYPGFGPRALFELEMQAFADDPDCPVLWAAAAGSNQSVARDIFLDSGGFDPRISINEHRELALRLCQTGCRMAASSARTYHMIHRSGWRDPLVERDWEEIFFAAHPIPAVALLQVFWASLAEPCELPPAARIASLSELAAAAERCRDAAGGDPVLGRDRVLQAHRRWADEAAS
jgi:GT2 family glycosyltransferase